MSTLGQLSGGSYYLGGYGAQGNNYDGQGATGGGLGGGGAVEQAGTPSTGGGGGGVNNPAGGFTAGRAGGSGGAVIYYKGALVGTGGTITKDGEWNVHTFTESGTFTPPAGGGGGSTTSLAIDSAIIGGGGANTGNAGDNGGYCQFDSWLLPITTYDVVVGAIGGISSFNGATAAAGTSNGNSGQVHWGWDDSTNCDAWGGGSGGGPNGKPGGGASSGEYFAQGGNGGDGNLWNVNSTWYAGGTGGLRGGAGTGTDGANGLGADKFGGANRAGGVIISYLGEAKFTGGTVSTLNTGTKLRTLHTFSTSGKLTPI
jgi:hypothetical protein